VFLGSKHAIGQFLTQTPDVSGFRGTLINVSSIGGVVGLMRCTAYCAAKAAIIGLTRATALEYADRGIRCNAILPGCKLPSPAPSGPLLTTPPRHLHSHVAAHRGRLSRLRGLS
jgi:NAD(P)-dependent dehydrogenase (short-subunit alcohol dehydrogenase family)